jgi:hypothetical protein
MEMSIMNEVQTLATTPTGMEDLEAEAMRSFVQEVSQLSQVEAVLQMGGNGGIRIWTVMSQDDDATRERIYALQGEAIGQVPYPLFDFHVTTCEGGLLTEWMPTRAVILFRRGINHANLDAARGKGEAQ